MTRTVLLFAVFLLVTFIAMGRFSEKSDENKVTGQDVGEKVLTALVKNKLGVGPANITIPGSKGTQIELSVSGDEGVENPQELHKACILPGSEVLSYIRGIDDDTINIKLSTKLEQVEKSYQDIFLKVGFKEENRIMRDGLFSTRWVKQGTKFRVLIYAFRAGDHTHLSLVLPRI